MNAVINQLTPASRALLHAALEHFKNNIKQEFANVVLSGESELYREFFTYIHTEVIALENTLFADCFIEDLEFMQHFKAHYKTKKQKSQTMPVTNKENTFEGS
jgi:hypothetical protein